jgi:hypothetical protein
MLEFVKSFSNILTDPFGGIAKGGDQRRYSISSGYRPDLPQSLGGAPADPPFGVAKGVDQFRYGISGRRPDLSQGRRRIATDRCLASAEGNDQWRHGQRPNPPQGHNSIATDPLIGIAESIDQRRYSVGRQRPDPPQVSTANEVWSIRILDTAGKSFETNCKRIKQEHTARLTCVVSPRFYFSFADR